MAANTLETPDWGNAGSYQPGWEDEDAFGPYFWDSVMLGGLPVPGECRVKCPLKRDVDKKKAKGKCGGTITDNGEDMTSVTITTQLTSPQWKLFQDLLPKIWPRKKGGKRSPVSIEHPKTFACGIDEVYIESVDIGDPENGRITVTIECTEWLIAPKDAPKPKPSAGPSSEAEKKYCNPSMRAITDMFADPSSEAGRHAAANNVDDIIAGNGPPLTEISPSF
jgi:hypothetical protein